MSLIPDQRLFWDEWHETHTTAGKGSHGDDAVEAFAGQLRGDRQLRVLELGCGQGRQAIYLAQAGHSVSAFDRSPVAIAAAERNAVEAGVTINFAEHDLADRLPYLDKSFDGAFSHLSLHYFDDAITTEIFSELARVLRPGSPLYFTVRSTRDPFYGQGDWLGRDLFCNDGHVRRFFSREYALKELSEWEVHIAEYYRIGGDRRANPGIYLRVLANLPSANPGPGRRIVAAQTGL